MNSDYYSADKSAGTAQKDPDPDKPCCCEELKQSVADRLCRAASTLEKTAADHEKNSDLADVEQHLAQWLNQSAEYIRQFDYAREKTNVSSHIADNPGRSLMIAGAAGLVLGILLRKS